MKYNELINKTLTELYDAYLQAKKEQFGLRISASTAQLKDTSKVRKVRRDLARIKTRLHEIKAQ